MQCSRQCKLSCYSSLCFLEIAHRLISQIRSMAHLFLNPQHLQAILNAMKSHILMLKKQMVEKISLKKLNFSISEKSEKSER